MAMKYLARAVMIGTVAAGMFLNGCRAERDLDLIVDENGNQIVQEPAAGNGWIIPEKSDFEKYIERALEEAVSVEEMWAKRGEIEDPEWYFVEGINVPIKRAGIFDPKIGVESRLIAPDKEIYKEIKEFQGTDALEIEQECDMIPFGEGETDIASCSSILAKGFRSKIVIDNIPEGTDKIVVESEFLTGDGEPQQKSKITLENKEEKIVGLEDFFKYRPELGIGIFTYANPLSRSSKDALEEWYDDNQKIFTRIVRGRAPEEFSNIMIGVYHPKVRLLHQFFRGSNKLISRGELLVRRDIGNGEPKLVSFYYSPQSHEAGYDTVKITQDTITGILAYFIAKFDEGGVHYGLQKLFSQHRSQELVSNFPDETLALERAYESALEESYILDPIEVIKWIRKNKEDLEEGIEEIMYHNPSLFRMLTFRKRQKDYPIQLAQGEFHNCFDESKFRDIILYFQKTPSLAVVYPVMIGDSIYLIVGEEKEVNDISERIKNDARKGEPSSIAYVPTHFIAGKETNTVFSRPYILYDVKGIVITVQNSAGEYIIPELMDAPDLKWKYTGQTVGKGVQKGLDAAEKVN